MKKTKITSSKEKKNKRFILLGCFIGAGVVAATGLTAGLVVGCKRNPTSGTIYGKESFTTVDSIHTSYTFKPNRWNSKKIIDGKWSAVIVTGNIDGVFHFNGNVLEGEIRGA